MFLAIIHQAGIMSSINLDACGKPSNRHFNTKHADKMLRPIPFAYNFNLLPINFQSRLVQDLDGSLENSMSRIILQHVSLHKMKSELQP